MKAPKDWTPPPDAKVTVVNLSVLGLDAPPSPGESVRGDGDGQTRKYGNRRVRADGHVFDSVKEFERYNMLRLLERCGAVRDLNVHPEYVLAVNGHRICKFIPDFEYVLVETGERVIEDCKSEPTRQKASYRLKRKLMYAIHGITVKEIL